MRMFRASMVLAFTGIIFAASTPEQGAPVPRKAPEFVFNLQDGKQFLLSSLRGKVVAIAFMFTTCPHCQALCPILANIQKDYAAKGVQFVGDVINEDAKDGLLNFNTLYVRNAFPVGWSTQDAALEFLKHPDKHYYVPMMAFVDRAGMIRSQYIGNDEAFFGSQDKSIRAELDKLLAGKTAVSKSSTPKK
ncbi:MAG TPA: TlpA disulfide reductase family protein [Bryobacteraceae bacterium]